MMSVATIFNENNFWADNFRVTERVFESFISTFYNRLLLVIPTLGSFNYDLIETINRINFTRICDVPLLRAGASPGPVASMFYVPLFPMGLILLPLFYAYIIRCIDRHLIRDFRYNIFTLISIGIFLLPMFEAPLNIFYIIDPMFVFLCILLIYKRINIFRLYKVSTVNSENNLVSIIMPCYNSAFYIENSISSVINQSYSNWEFIIIDDGSTDHTEAKVEELRHKASSKIQLITKIYFH